MSELLPSQQTNSKSPPRSSAPLSLSSSCMHDQMLESNRDDVKLEAMRCVTVMTAKGKLSVPRTLFPHIVKNVSSKNTELKKLIYLYLTSFADQEPDLALLPVATLQKSLKSPNPLIRSSALKVLTSMRLSILSAILMATLRNSVNDLSPYVRKTVAHSIIKIYRLDPSLRGELIEYIERLFNDKNSMVLSSAVASFEIVCPERLDLVHKHYRRFCFILADCNEWGQTLLIRLLERFVKKTHQDLKNGSTSDYNPSDHDPKYLLRSAKPLIHSNNSAVVMAVIKLYIAIANFNEVRSNITKPLIRLLYSQREVQLTALNFIEELTTLDSKEQYHGAIKDQEVDSKKGLSEVCNETKEPEQVGLTTIINTVSVESEVDSEPKPARDEAKVSENNDNDGDDNDSDEDNDEEEDTGEDDESEDEDDDDDDDDVEDEDEDDDTDEDDEDEASTSQDGEDQSDRKVENGKMDFVIDSIDFTTNNDPSAYREIFRPYIKSFFVKHSDCTQIRLAKLRILTNLSSSANINLVLRELQAYVSTYVDDREFVSAAIQALGRCAIIVEEVAHTCLNGLTTLLSNNNEHIVSEAIVVLRSQIIGKEIHDDSKKSQETSEEKIEEQSNETIEKSNSTIDDDKIASTVIKQVTKLLPTVTAPQARATILWIVAEFCDKNITAAKCAPNVIRLIAKSFCQEDNFVKLQGLTLASKFLLSLDKEKKAELYKKTHLLTGYLFSLAKYDINHDVRDRGRFLKKLLENEDICSKVLLSKPHQVDTCVY